MVWWYHNINTDFHHAKGVICTCNMWSTPLSWPVIAWCTIKGSAKLSNFYPYVPLIYMYLTIYDTPPCPITLNCLNFIYSYPIIHTQIVICISIKKKSLKKFPWDPGIDHHVGRIFNNLECTLIRLDVCLWFWSSRKDFFAIFITCKYRKGSQ